jgi:hypothetical protein
MKKNIYQRLGANVLQVAALVALLLVARTFFPHTVYAVAPIALAAILGFVLFSGILKKLICGRNS